MNPFERDRLPEIRQVVQRVPAVGEVDEVTLVLVREEAGVHALDVGEPASSTVAEPGEHDGRHVDRDDASALGAAASVNCPVPAPRSSTVDEAFRPSPSSSTHLCRGICVFLVVVAGNVVRVEVLASGMGDLVQPPT